MAISEAQSGNAVRDRGLHGNQLQHIELARRTEQYAAFVLRLARCSMRGPCCVALREIECLRVGRLVFLPSRYRIGDSQLERLQSLRPIQQRVQLRALTYAIERRSDNGLVGV